MNGHVFNDSNVFSVLSMVSRIIAYLELAVHPSPMPQKHVTEALYFTVLMIQNLLCFFE